MGGDFHAASTKNNIVDSAAGCEQMAYFFADVNELISNNLYHSNIRLQTNRAFDAYLALGGSYSPY